MGTPRKSKRTFILAAIILSLAGMGITYFKYSSRSSVRPEENFSTCTVTRSDLVMSVNESGTIKARNSVEIKSQVEGSTTIVSIVPEGTNLTQEDVDRGRVILELDASQLTDRVNQQEIDYNSAEADYTEARESLDIQINQNDSDVQKGLMTVKFGLMDLRKYLGEVTAAKVVSQYDPNEVIKFDVASLIKDPNQLGGASLQELRELESSITLAEQELKQAIINLDWTRKLYAKQYESRSELETAELSADRLKIRWDQAKTALDLFIRYEFPKEAERLFSEYVEAGRELQRVHAQARSKLAQAQARLKSMEARYVLEKERLQKLQQQLSACSVKATAPGLVIYASSNRGRYGGSRTYIEVGQEIRERELIMTITDAEEKDVDVKVHETNIDKVRINQPVRIVVDAQPDKVFYGSVKKISQLPDPASFFGNPDLKVYTTEVSIENIGPQIKPGMSARVEIIIAELNDVLSIPVQSVANREGRKVCFLATADGSKETPIITGAFNDRFIQVLDGITEGQKILLNPPRLLTDTKARENRPLTVQREKPAIKEAGEAVPAAPAAGGAAAQPASDRGPGATERPQRPDGEERRRTRLPAGSRPAENGGGQQP